MRSNFPGSQQTETIVRDFAAMSFSMADVTASFWQPWLKGMGRLQLEASSLMVANLHASFAYTRAMSRAQSAADVAHAGLAFADSVAENFKRVAPRVTGAFTQATEPVLPFDVIAFPRASERPQTGTRLPEPQANTTEQPARRVA